MTPQILVTYQPPGDALDILTDIGSVNLWPGNGPMPRDELLAGAQSAHAIYSMLTDRIDDELLEAAPNLVIVSNMAVGYDNIDVAVCSRRGIAVGHTPDVLTDTVADTAFGLLIAAARRFGEGAAHVRSGSWRRWEPELLWGQDVHGSTLGIVGFGRIGRAVAQRARGFDMRVIVTSRRRSSYADELGVIQVDFQELLGRADHVVVAVPLTEETTHMFDATAFVTMKRTATLVNVSRGAIVDTAALREALESGQIGAAGLDVTDPEPLPADHPLLQLPNCYVIPHLGSSTARTRAAMADLAARNVVAGLQGLPLPASVNPEIRPQRIVG